MGGTSACKHLLKNHAAINCMKLSIATRIS